jgi:hypothetical protein
VVICHCEATWVSPLSEPEKIEDVRAGVRLVPAPSAGEILVGWFGGRLRIVWTGDVSQDYLLKEAQPLRA